MIILIIFIMITFIAAFYVKHSINGISDYTLIMIWLAILRSGGLKWRDNHDDGTESDGSGI